VGTLGEVMLGGAAASEVALDGVAADEVVLGGAAAGEVASGGDALGEVALGCAAAVPAIARTSNAVGTADLMADRMYTCRANSFRGRSTDLSRARCTRSAQI